MGGTPGLAKQGASGESVASASSFRDYCQGTIHQRRPERSAQTARRPPGSLQIALARGEGALRHHRGAGDLGRPRAALERSPPPRSRPGIQGRGGASARSGEWRGGKPKPTGSSEGARVRGGRRAGRNGQKQKEKHLRRGKQEQTDWHRVGLGGAEQGV